MSDQETIPTLRNCYRAMTFLLFAELGQRGYRVTFPFLVETARQFPHLIPAMRELCFYVRAFLRHGQFSAGKHWPSIAPSVWIERRFTKGPTT